MSDKTPFHLRHSRRRFLQVAGATGFTVVASGLGDYAVAQTPAAFENVAQAPVLEGQDLPPAIERIGDEPLVLRPHESVGQYGGILRSALIGGQDTAWLSRTVNYDNLVTWSTDWSEILPNVARAFEVSEDGRSYTFTLRRGMKWSDGAPFTSADVEFYVNNVYRNEELTSSLGADPFTIEVTDDVTFTIIYDQPNGFALLRMCEVDGNEWIRYPRHYLEQFHNDFNPDGIGALIEEDGAADWIELFRRKGGGIPGTPYNSLWSNPELPRIHAWQLAEPYGDGTRVSFTRNPYYWKVDPDGQQLPYIDEVTFDVLPDTEVMLLRATSGDIDFHSRHINTNANKSVLAQSQETSGYEFFDLVDASMNTCVLSLNLTHKNEAMRKIFQNKDFRIGLSHAINRQEIIDVVYVSQGEPWQLGPRQESDWYNETLAKQYTEYDVAVANEHLDRVLPDKGGDGYRLMPSGEPFSFVVEATADYDPTFVDTANLVVSYWNAVGVNVSLRPGDRSLLEARTTANEHDCAVWYGEGGLQDAILGPRWYFPFGANTHFAPAWFVWYQEPANAAAAPMEPPANVQEQMNLYDQIEASPDPAVRTQLFNELLVISQEMFYAIGVSVPGPGYGIKKANLRNVPSSMPLAWLYPTPAPTRLEQYYYEGGQQLN
ncbi:MAG: ABC transporter substrate-binding protein [Chloroflexota bacterium]|nr:ABC transporter substrate-binding protein [Chloroflexota bacterium]